MLWAHSGGAHPLTPLCSCIFPLLSHVSLGAKFTCPAQVLPPQEATAFISQQFPCKAVSPGGSYFGTQSIGSALAFCCALGHRTNVQIPLLLLSKTQQPSWDRAAAGRVHFLPMASCGCLGKGRWGQRCRYASPKSSPSSRYPGFEGGCPPGLRALMRIWGSSGSSALADGLVSVVLHRAVYGLGDLGGQSSGTDVFLAPQEGKIWKAE